ncbi:MCE family protein [Nocardioides massiliensis]|uniref:Phospholipid/cholesterol/gamma-HCH transport system substrate-binding protein n=1 Tax=Nocardioides massiliensis TaxID=1325935 RepID=A0ABT9NP46_9ACTN|nr:MCE family protein [Nocardioides massiliensis]MDP9821984.1 phospholipid/cholesterol/gamma-HCH transport system substrate-binding protein [Nocardioides massiliensis]
MKSTLAKRALGLVSIALILGFVWTTYAVFSKTFVSYDEITLRSSKLGLQLPTRADVKFRGVIVGEVREISSTGNGAELVLGLYPAQRDQVPADVTARILPKTLFGEKYVALDAPSGVVTTAIEPGAVIEQAEVAIEVEQVLSDLYPLLETLQPQLLNRALTAISTALEGRGDQLGENLEVLDSYLARFNPQIPTLVDDLRQLSQVSQVYGEVLPDIARTLRNAVTTGATFQEKEQRITALFSEVTAFSGTTRDFVEANGQNIIRLADQGQQILPVFAKQAPIYPCFLEAMAKIAPRQAEAFRGHTLHINLELLPAQPRGYSTADLPRYAEDRAPDSILGDCRRAMNDTWGQDNLPPQRLVPELADGVDSPTGKGVSPNRVAPEGLDVPGIDLSSGYAGSRAEQEVVGTVLGPVLGRSYDEVPAIASLLFAPLARGTEVSLR